MPWDIRISLTAPTFEVFVVEVFARFSSEMLENFVTITQDNDSP